MGGTHTGSGLAAGWLGPEWVARTPSGPPPPFQQPELLVIHDEENAAQYARVQPARNIPIGFPIVIPIRLKYHRIYDFPIGKC